MSALLTTDGSGDATGLDTEALELDTDIEEYKVICSDQPYNFQKDSFNEE
jgi:hypothetical protein